jgi:ABC-type molybdate transport system ATPase subunit
MGLAAAQGRIRFRNKDIAGLRPDQVAHCGIGYVPEDRLVFSTLTVRQNLELGLKRAGKFGRWTFDDVFALFPNLGERQDVSAGVLSGGEQQMLTKRSWTGKTTTLSCKGTRPEYANCKFLADDSASAPGHSRRFERLPTTFGLRQTTDIPRVCWHVSNVPQAVVNVTIDLDAPCTNIALPSAEFA